jgi:hypothetical protein
MPSKSKVVQAAQAVDPNEVNREAYSSRLMNAERGNLNFLHKMSRPDAFAEYPEEGIPKMKRIIARAEMFHRFAVNMQVYIEQKGVNKKMESIIEDMEDFSNTVAAFV